ncbi:MazG-like family protein [Caldibacillus thermoamylovorans]|uniref:MazG-like family protein n=1 Tax=Caldibacillus thermoamylovorans TaxID=35841 RepID=UPI001D08B87D|nr:MazG-like family protein [Bacillus sp. DFI.2.34]MCB7076449.1 MazG-like family protein [Caldibacillus thermoamylovorans]
MIDDLTVKIHEWAVYRNLHTADPNKQMLKLIEEVGELATGIAKDNEWKIADSIGDVYVVLTILSMQLGLNISTCVENAYEEIKNRKGKMIKGVYVKEADLK